MEELSDTLAALNVKFECVHGVNTKLEAQLRAQEHRCREYAVNGAKQLAIIETLEEELARARERDEQLSAENKRLQMVIECCIRKAEEGNRVEE